MLCQMKQSLKFINLTYEDSFCYFCAWHLSRFINTLTNMKGTIIYIALALTAIVLLASCSSEKKLQRRIERHGIKESIGFVVGKYPEYFKSKDTTIHDTTIIERLVEVPTIDTTVILSDSSNFYHYMSDSLSLLVNKLTGSVKIKIKQRRVYIHDTITISVPCPEIICPDCEDLKDNTKDGPGFKWWWLILIGVILAAFYIWANRNVNN